MVVEKIAQNTRDSKKGAVDLLFKLYYLSFPTVHGKKANITADILMLLHSINLSVALVMHISSSSLLSLLRLLVILRRIF